MTSPDPLEGADGRMVCAVCTLPLNIVENEDGGGYVHAIDGVTHNEKMREDHVAVPTWASDVASINARCDFCYEPATWTFPCRDFESPLGTTSTGPWAACDVCKNAVVAGDTDAMLTLGIAGYVNMARERGEDTAWVNGNADFAAVISEYHRRFLEHRFGDPIPGGYVAVGQGGEG